MNGLSMAFLAFFSLLSLPSYFTSPTHTFSWETEIQQEVFIIATELNGPTEIETWDQPHIQVQTLIWDHTGSEYSLDYCKKQGNFRLETRTEQAGSKLVIASRKINSMLFVQGKEVKTKKQYKVWLPRHLEYEDKTIK